MAHTNRTTVMLMFLLIATTAHLATAAHAASPEALVSSQMNADSIQSTGRASAFYLSSGDGSRFDLVAPDVVIAELTEDRGVGTIFFDPNDPTESWNNQTFQDVSLSADIQDRGAVFIHPMGDGFSIESFVTDARIRTEESPILRVPERPRYAYDLWSAPVEDALRIDTDGGIMRMQGDFIVSIWSANVQGTSERQPLTMWSGMEDESQVETGVIVDEKEVYLHFLVRDGILSLQAPSTAPLQTFLHGASYMEGAGGILRQASGTYKGIHIENQDIQLEDFSFLADVQNGALRMQDPAVATPNTAGTSQVPGSSGLFILVLVGAALLAAGIVGWRRYRRPETLPQLLEAMDKHAYGRVVRKADRTLDRTGNTAVAVMKAVALLALGRAKVALRYLEELPDHVRPLDGMDDFLRAHALNELDQEPEARVALRVALERNPSLVEELERFPRLLALLPDPEDRSSGVYA